MQENKVGILLLNWNGLQDTLECLDSLGRLDYTNRVVIVVDNNSNEDPQSLLDQFPDTVLVTNDTNSGFAGGNNIGFKKAADLGCDYCWVLNNDTIVSPDALTILVDALGKNQDIAAVTNLVTYFYQPDLSWFAGGIFKNGLPAIRGYFERISPYEHGNINLEDTEYLCGCSFLARMKALEEVGGFDEAYFCYVEDVDLSLMLKKKGHRIGYVADAVVTHKVSRASGNRSPLKLYYKHRNMLYFIKKHKLPASIHRQWWKVSMRTMASLMLKHGKPKAAWNLWRGLLDGEFNRMGKCTRF